MAAGQDRMGAIAERVAKLEGHIGPIAREFQEQEKLRVRLAAASSYAEQGDAKGALRELLPDLMLAQAQEAGFPEKPVAKPTAPAAPPP